MTASMKPSVTAASAALPPKARTCLAASAARGSSATAPPMKPPMILGPVLSSEPTIVFLTAETAPQPVSERESAADRGRRAIRFVKDTTPEIGARITRLAVGRQRPGLVPV